MTMPASFHRIPPRLLTRICAQLLVAGGAIVLYGCANSVLLDERFHDSRLANWTVVDDPNTLEGPSDWRVGEDGWLHQRSNIWGLRGDFLGRWYGTYLIAGDAGWTDLTLSVRARPRDDDGFGVVLRFQDAEHFYRLLFLQDGMSGGAVTRLDRRDGADYTELWSTPKGYRAGQEMHVQVEVLGNVIRGWVDDKQLFEIKDNSYSHGKIGLYCYAQSDQAFDDLKVVSK